MTLTGCDTYTYHTTSVPQRMHGNDSQPKITRENTVHHIWDRLSGGFFDQKIINLFSRRRLSSPSRFLPGSAQGGVRREPGHSARKLFFDQFGGSETQKMNFRDVGVWLTSDVPASVCVLDNAIVMIYECLARAVESLQPNASREATHTGNIRCEPPISPRVQCTPASALSCQDRFGNPRT